MQETQYSPKDLARWRVFSTGFALLTFVIGGAAFFGWIFDNAFLKRIHPSLVTMKANTAVCLMLAAISILLIHDRPTRAIKCRISQVCAAIVSIVGLLTLSE